MLVVYGFPTIDLLKLICFLEMEKKLLVCDTVDYCDKHSMD